MNIIINKNYAYKTICEDGYAKKLTEKEIVKFNEFLDYYESENASDKRLITLRGVSLRHLAEKLSTETDAHEENQILRLLFYFGDKAKHYYKSTPGALNSRLLLKDENVDLDSSREIFTSIASIFDKNKSEFAKFTEKNSNFCFFFKDFSNIELFCTKIKKIGLSARDYYLYFLHTAGIPSDNEESYFVSTSIDFKVAERFAKGKNNLDKSKIYVICYIVPDPKEEYAVSHIYNMPIENKLIQNKLPTFEGLALYPEYKEVGIKRALFSSFILGVFKNEDKSFIINPYFFCESNTIHCILNSGIEFDQSDFKNKLKKETKYNKGVCVFLKENLFASI